MSENASAAAHGVQLRRADGARGRLQQAWMPAALVVLCLVAFAGVGRNGFVRLDDGVYVTENPVVAAGVTPRGLAWAFTTTHAANWHPLTWLSHQVDVELFGLRPGPQHLVSLLLHTAASIVAFRVFLLLGGARWTALLAAALFAVHPLRVESVAWVAERKDVLSMFLALSALLAWTGWVRRRSVRSLALSTALYALALMAKPMPVTLPFALLLLDWWPLGRWEPGSPRHGLRRPLLAAVLPPAGLWAEKLPLFLLAAAASVVSFAAQSGGGAITGLQVLPLDARAANAAVSYVRYLANTLWPADLAVWYPHPTGMLPAVRWAGALTALAALTLLALRCRRQPWVAVGWLWYLGTLVPMIGLVQAGAQARADRYTYLPHVGLLFAASWSAARLARRPGWRSVAVVGSITAVTLCVAATVVQVGYWRSDLTLFTRALAVFEGRSATATVQSGAGPDLHRGPSGALLHNYRGLALEDEGRFTEALEEFRSAEGLHPHHAETQNNIARSLERAGRLDEAIARYERAVANSARNAVMRSNLGAALIRRGDAGRAAGVLREALALDPDDAETRNNLGIALALLGDREGAERELRRALADRPGYADARSNLARLLREAGRAAEAEALVAGPPRERVPRSP